MSAMTVDLSSGRPRLRAVPGPTAGRDVGRLVHLASAAVAMVSPHGPAVALPPFGTATAARAWLEAELPALLAVPDPDFARRLAPVLSGWLAATGRHREAAELFARALIAGGGPAERIRLGDALTRIGWHAQAAEHYRVAAVAGLDRCR